MASSTPFAMATRRSTTRWASCLFRYRLAFCSSSRTASRFPASRMYFRIAFCLKKCTYARLRDSEDIRQARLAYTFKPLSRNSPCELVSGVLLVRIHHCVDLKRRIAAQVLLKATSQILAAFRFLLVSRRSSRGDN